MTGFPADMTLDQMLPNRIATFSGMQIDPLKPDPGQIRIEDIARSLANSARWLGHTVRRFSVAEHCIIGANSMTNPVDRFEFLMHDATEAYLPDLPRPLKERSEFAFYREAESHLWWAIAAKFGLPMEHSAPVYAMDREMAEVEFDALLHRHGGSATALGRAVQNSQSHQAERSFLRSFYQMVYEYGEAKGQL